MNVVFFPMGKKEMFLISLDELIKYIINDMWKSKFEKYIYIYILRGCFKAKHFKKFIKNIKMKKYQKKCLYYQYEEWFETNDLIPYAYGTMNI